MFTLGKALIDVGPRISEEYIIDKISGFTTLKLTSIRVPNEPWYAFFKFVKHFENDQNLQKLRVKHYSAMINSTMFSIGYFLTYVRGTWIIIGWNYNYKLCKFQFQHSQNRSVTLNKENTSCAT